MTSSMARQYERLLLVAYPRRYRARRGAELLATLLDGAEPGRRRPAIGDVVDLLRHGLRVRTGLTSDAAPGRVFALAAPFGLAVAAGLSVIALTYGELPIRATISPPVGQYGFGPFETTGVIVYGLVLAALVGFLCKATRIAWALSVGGALAAVASHLVSSHGGTAGPNLTLLAVIALCLTPLAIAPLQRLSRSRGTRIAGAAVVAVLGLLGPVMFSTPPWSGGWVDQREAFYRSGSGIVPLSTPAIPVLLLLVLPALTGYATSRRRLEVWMADCLLLLPAALWTFGGARIAAASSDAYSYHGGHGAFSSVLGAGGAIALQSYTRRRRRLRGTRPAAAPPASTGDARFASWPGRRGRGGRAAGRPVALDRWRQS